MSVHIHQCPSCLRYTLEKECSVCRVPALLTRPPKFSFEDKYAGYRREARKRELAEKGRY